MDKYLVEYRDQSGEIKNIEIVEEENRLVEIYDTKIGINVYKLEKLNLADTVSLVKSARLKKEERETTSKILEIDEQVRSLLAEKSKFEGFLENLKS